MAPISDAEGGIMYRKRTTRIQPVDCAHQVMPRIGPDQRFERNRFYAEQAQRRSGYPLVRPGIPHGKDHPGRGDHSTRQTLYIRDEDQRIQIRLIHTDRGACRPENHTESQKAIHHPLHATRYTHWCVTSVNYTSPAISPLLPLHLIIWHTPRQ